MQSKPEISGIPDWKDAIKMYLGFCEKDSEANNKEACISQKQ